MISAAGHGPRPEPRRAAAIACAARLVADLYFIDLIYDGERLPLAEYAKIVLRDEDPLDCYLPGNRGPDPDFTWHLAQSDIAEIVLLAAAFIAETERGQWQSLLLDRDPGDEEPGL